MHSGRISLAAYACALVAAVALLVTPRAEGVDAERCARFAFQSQARERLVTGQGRAVAVLGDSYSVGLGLRHAARSWPAQLPGRVRVYGFSGSGFAAGASPCRHASYGARVRQAARVADTVVVEGGLNDYDQPEARIRAGVREVLAALRGKRVLVVGPAAAPARADRVARVDGILAEECARAGVAYLSTEDLRLPYLADRLHLTAAGHRSFGRSVAEALDALG